MTDNGVRPSPATAARRLTLLYDQHKAGTLSGTDDEAWGYVQEQIRRFARMAVCALSPRLFGEPLEQRVDDVYTRLITKFLEGRLDYQGDTMEPLLQRAARNDARDSFRRSRSATAVCFDGAEETWESRSRHVEPDEPDASHDLFGAVRSKLDPFRFPEHPHVRECVLAQLLTTGAYPGPSALHSLSVHPDHRLAVYNAAVVDINTAVQELVAPTV